MLPGALLSAVNLAEVHSRLLAAGAGADFAWQRLNAMGLDIRDFDAIQARLAAELVAKTEPSRLSLGERACLALAIHNRATVYTTDSGWKELPLEIEMQVIG